MRSGSRKNPRDASEAAAKGRASRRRPLRASRAARTPGTSTNGQPSRATGIRDTAPPYIRGGLIQDIIARSRLPTSSI